MVVPVVNELKKRGGWDISVIGLTTAGPVLEKAGIPYLGFKDFLLPQDWYAVETGKRLTDELVENSAKSPGVSMEETIAYLGLSYSDLEENLGKDEAHEKYKLLGRHAFFPVITMKRILREVSPDMVIATNSPRAERAAIIAAGELGIPCVCMVDLFALQEVKWIGKRGYANKLCVNSEYTKKILLATERIGEEVIVTGNPAFDRLGDPGLFLKAAEFRRERKIENKKMILWASQPEPAVHSVNGRKGDKELPFKIGKKLIEIMKKHSDWHLAYRPHPSETRFLVCGSENMSFEKDSDLAVLLCASDAVVTSTSTVGLEGALLGKPLVTIDLSVFSPDMPYSEMGLSIGVSDFSMLEAAVKKAFEKGAAPYEGLPKPGKSACKVADVIEKLC